MDIPTQTELLAIGIRVSALGLILGSFMLLITGAAGSLGGSFRTTIEPLLQWVRDRSTLSRSELADVSLVIAVVLAVSSAIVDRSAFAVLVAAGLWLSRPAIRRATREENKLFAAAALYSIDLMIGLYTPIMLAQFLLGEILLGSTLLGVVISLSWPAGGGTTIPGRRWHLAPVPS